MSEPEGNCFGQWWLFELAESDHWLYAGMPFSQMYHLNEEHVAKAQDLCMTCTRYNKCVDSARPDDIEWSVRAGIGPLKTLGWTPPQGASAPQCAHNRDGAEPVCPYCLSLARKERDKRLRERSGSGTIEDVSRSTD